MSEQHGVVSAAQLRTLGVSRQTVDRWIAGHRVERVGPRVFRVAGSATTWEQRLSAGLLSLGPQAAVSHRSAARLHRFDRANSDAVEFLVPNASRSARLDETVHSSKLISPIDFVPVSGFRCTSATRTILDLANIQVHPDQLKAAIDSAVRMQLSAPEAIRVRLTAIRKRGRTGVRMIDRLLDDSGGHTMLERKFFELMRLEGLPRPQPQVVFSDGKRTLARVDFFYREWGIIVEVSGRLGHSSPSERARDAQRRNELQDLGWRVYEFTWEDVTRRAWWVRSKMRTRLEAAGWAA